EFRTAVGNSEGSGQAEPFPPLAPEMPVPVLDGSDPGMGELGVAALGEDAATLATDAEAEWAEEAVPMFLAGDYPGPFDVAPEPAQQGLGRSLVDRQPRRETDLVRALAHRIGLEFVDLSECPVDPSCAALIPEAVARRYRALPIAARDGRLLVAMSDPENVYA